MRRAKRTLDQKEIPPISSSTDLPAAHATTPTQPTTTLPTPTLSLPPLSIRHDEEILPFEIAEGNHDDDDDNDNEMAIAGPPSDWGELMACAGEYFDICLTLITGVTVSELALRMYLVGREYANYAHYYWPGQLVLESIWRAFTFSRAAQLLLLVTGALISTRYGMTNRMPVQPLHCLAFMPLYWLCKGAQLTHSTFDYVDIVRDRTGLDYAEGMASSYYHGYLKLVLPELHERIRRYEAAQNATFGVEKLIILIPSTLYTRPVIKSRYLEKARSLDVVIRDRAGVQRPYKNDVYRITTPIEGRFYYVTMEGATPLLSYYDAMDSRITSTNLMQDLQREILMKFYKSLRRMLKDSEDIHDQAELLFYNARKRDGSEQDVGEIILERLNDWRRLEKAAN